MLTFLMWMAGLVTVGGILAGSFVLWKIPEPISSHIQRHDVPSLSIIIPARNEAERITPLLIALQSQTLKVRETIVVDDGSTDHTADIAKQYGAQVIRNDLLHEGHSGKSLACWTGAQAAHGEWLLFLDADTTFPATDSLETIAYFYQKHGSKGLMSIQPYHTVKHLYEHFSAVFNVIVMAGMNDFTIWKDRLPSAGAFGPCLLCDKEAYFTSGGHEGIQEAIMDDLALAEEFRKSGYPVLNLGGRDLVSFRMYPEGIGQLIEGWTKNFATASHSTHPAVMTLISLWIGGGLASGIGFYISLWALPSAWGLVLTSSIFYVGYMLHFGWMVRRTGNFKRWVCIFYPFLFIFFTILFLYSLYRTKVLRTVSWRGRNINV